MRTIKNDLAHLFDVFFFWYLGCSVGLLVPKVDQSIRHTKRYAFGGIVL